MSWFRRWLGLKGMRTVAFGMPESAYRSYCRLVRRDGGKDGGEMLTRAMGLYDLALDVYEKGGRLLVEHSDGAIFQVEIVRESFSEEETPMPENVVRLFPRVDPDNPKP